MEPPIQRDIALALEAIYRRGVHTFWRSFTEAPQQAVDAFRTNPESFGAVATDYGQASREREHRRILKLMDILMNR